MALIKGVMGAISDPGLWAESRLFDDRGLTASLALDAWVPIVVAAG
jgi:hypothetical protein